VNILQRQLHHKEQLLQALQLKLDNVKDDRFTVVEDEKMKIESEGREE
jgi:hypothetical protein